MSSKRLCMALAGIVIAAQTTMAGQSQEKPAEQAVRLKAELIEMRVVVTDRKGQPVDNLKQENFEVLVEGKPQPISFFSFERAGAASRGASPEIKGPPATRPAAPRPAPAPARTVVLFVDNIHLPPFSFIRVKEALKRFIDEQLTEQDLVAVVATYGNLGVLQQFMRDRNMLKRAVDKIAIFSHDASLFTPYLAARITSNDQGALQVGIQILSAEEGPVTEGYVQARAAQAIARETNLRQATLGTLRAVCDRMAEMPGQRLVVLVSDGFTALEQGGGSDSYMLQSVTGRAARSGVVIYSLEAKGLTVSPELSASNPGIQSPSFSRYMSESESDSRGNLKTLAYETGGEAFANHNDLGLPLKKILDGNSTYYVLAYYGPDDSNDNKFRKVSIRVKDHPEYKVRAPKGYLPPVASKAEAAMTPRQQLLKSMLTPLPATGIAVESWADYLESDADNAQVTLRVIFDAGPIQYQQSDQGFRFDCEVAVAAFDASGKLIESFADRIHATMTAAHVEQARRNGYRYGKRLKLKPGLYQVRAGVSDAVSGQLGTSMTWVEVPDLSKGKLALSSIFLARESAADRKALPNGGANKPAVVAEPIEGRAVFKSGDIAPYRVVAYNALSPDAKKPVMLKVDILRDGKPVFEGQWQDLASRLIRQSARGAEVGGRLALELPPGFYELRISAGEGKSKKALQQTVTFEIEPGK